MVNSVDTIFSGTNGAFIAELYERYLEDPSSVDASWAIVFSNLGDDKTSIERDITGASWALSKTSIIGSSETDIIKNSSNF